MSGACIAVELASRRRLFTSHSPCHDLGSCVALRTDCGASHAAEHGELSDVGECIGKRSLDQFFDRPGERRITSELAVELRKPVEKTIDLHVPVVASARLPDGFTSRERDRPRHEVAQMRHDLNRLPGRRADGRGGELGRDVPEHFGGAIRERCDEMTDYRAGRIGSRQWLGSMCRLHDASVHTVPGTCNTQRNGD